MAEERLIDDDKDRKYKIRIGENGEEELVIEGGDEDETVFDIPVFEEDDEEAVDLTPDMLAERDRLRKQEEQARAERCGKFLTDARSALEGGEYESALYAVNKAVEAEEKCGEAHFLKLKILTRGMTEFNSLEDCAETADNVASYCGAEMKAELKENASGLESRIEEVKKRTEELGAKNEAGKAERRGAFASAKKKAFTMFLGTACPFAVLLITAIVLSTMMFADERGAYLIATIAVGALALIAFIAMLVCANRLWTAERNVKLNEADTSTKSGREYLESKTELDLLTRIYSSFEK